MAQNVKKKSVTLHISGMKHYMIFIYGTLLWNYISWVFFIFSKFWFSGLLGGCKREKAVQNVKKFCLLYSISQEPYIILLRLWYTYVKWWYLQGCFLFIQNFDFVGCWESKKAKNRPKWEKIMSLPLHISRTIHHMIFIYGTHVENDNVSRCFFHYFKILIFSFVRGLKGQKVVQNDKKFCLLHSISQEPYIVWLSFVVHK